MPSSSARTLKSPRRLQRRRDRRTPSPKWQFLRGFFKNPVMVGSIIPSSRVLIDKMLDPVDWANTRLFVEYGPGVGTFTLPLLDRMGPDATLGSNDRHQCGVHLLPEGELIDDPRLVAVTGDRGGDVEKILADRTLGAADMCCRACPSPPCPPVSAERRLPRPRPRSWQGRAARSWSISSAPKVLDFLKPYFGPIKRGFEWVIVPPGDPVLGIQGQ